MHELGLAFDLWVNDESQLSDLGTVWEQMGGVWGGHFKDPIHFEAGGDLSDYKDAAAQSVDEAAPPPVGRVQQVVDFVGSLAPGVGTIAGAGKLIESVAPSTKENPVVSMLSSPYQMIRQQPQFQFLSNIVKMLF